MKLLLTGASGFIGKEIMRKLIGTMEIVTLGRKTNAHICCNLGNDIPAIPFVDIVIHAAGKAHTVPGNQTEKEDFFKSNVEGTQNLLKGLENIKTLKKFIFLSSVSVYGLTAGTLINEQAPLLATDSYGRSKIVAEQLIENWCVAKNIDYYILRLPLVAGKNAPGNLGAMVKGITTGKYFSIGKARAKKSIVLAGDIGALLVSLNGKSGIYNLTDGQHPSFGELEIYIAQFFKKKIPFTISNNFAQALAFAGDFLGRRAPINSSKLRKITSTLTFDDSKATQFLQWKPTSVLKGWKPA